MLNVKIPRHEEGGQFQVNFGGNVLELTSETSRTERFLRRLSASG